MTQPGYEDYVRETFANGKLLARGQQRFSATTHLFTGYCGSWPYLNTFMNFGGGNSFYILQINYYSDATFTTLVAGTQEVRADDVYAIQQYTPLSPFVDIVILMAVNNTPGICSWSIYGSTGKSSSAQLASLSVNGIEQVNTVVAGSQSSSIGIVQEPGPWAMTWGASVAPCFFQLARYDVNTLGFVEFWEGSIEVANQSKTGIVEFPDAPWTLTQFNRAGANGSLKTFGYPLMY
jgi:hypothetical protein